MLIIVSFIINNINEKKKLEDYITKFCDNNSYEKINNFDDIKDSTSCGSITYFVKNMNKNEANLEELMNSNNELIYTIYYKINKVNIHNEVEFEGIYPDAYIDHLYNNDFEISNDMLDDLLSHALIDKNVEKFTKYSKYLAKYGYTWSNASRYFNYGEDKLYLSSMEYEYVNNE